MLDNDIPPQQLNRFEPEHNPIAQQIEHLQTSQPSQSP